MICFDFGFLPWQAGKPEMEQVELLTLQKSDVLFVSTIQTCENGLDVAIVEFEHQVTQNTVSFFCQFRAVQPQTALGIKTINVDHGT